MHRKTRIIPVGQIVTGIVLMVLSAILAVSAILLGSAPAAAAATVSQSHGRYWYDRETCHDFQLFEAGKRSFGQMYRASEHADAFLRWDVADWQYNRAHHGTKRILGIERSYVAMDCLTLSGYGRPE